MEARDIPLVIAFAGAVAVTLLVTVPAMRGAFKFLLVLLSIAS